MSENLLIDLSEPYLLNLIGLLTECMMRADEDTLEVAAESGYDLADQVLVRIDSLNYLQKAEVLAAASNHVLAIAQRDKEASLGGTSPNS